MPYSLKSVTIRTDNSKSGMAKINELWADIMQGKIPLDFIANGAAAEDIVPISIYSNYENDENGRYDLTITSANADVFKRLAKSVIKGKYYKIDETGATIAESANKAWTKVWELTKTGKLKRAFTFDYESVVPAEYTKDSKTHCYLYIAVK